MARAAQQRYSRTEKGQATQRRWNDTPKGKAARRAWKASEAGKASYKKWRHSEQGKTTKKRNRAATVALINEAKARPCADCGGSFPHVCMDFDHRDRTAKVDEVSRMKGYNPDRIRAEIAKCDVVCANCHRIRSWVRNDNRAPDRIGEVETQLALPIVEQLR